MRVYKLLTDKGGLSKNDEVVVVLVANNGLQVRVQRRDRYAGGHSDYTAFVQSGDFSSALQLLDNQDEPAHKDDKDAVSRDNMAAHYILGISSQLQSSSILDIGSIVQSISNSHSQQLSSQKGLSSTTTKVLPCQMKKHVPIVWEPTTDDLVVPVTICDNQTALLGHSFAEMAERESFLREESGVIAGKETVEGPNNALGEIRIMLANKACRAVQIALRFTDMNKRHLLFRSTAGHVLIADKEGGPDKLRTHDVTAKLTNDGYEANETFVHTGALSFFVQDESASDEPRLMTPQNYATHHELDYRMLVNGAKNAQQYHHSEQAFFKLLYDYPNAVSDAIDQILQPLVETYNKFVINAPIRVCAISVDIFTTRAACSGCQVSSQAVQTHAAHFFAQALKDINNQKHPVKVKIDKDIRRLVRIACARAFVGTPDTKSVKQAKLPEDGTVHALPDDPIKRPNIDEPHVQYLRLNVDVNHATARPLLRKGTERSEATWVQLQVNLIRTLDPGMKNKSLQQWWESMFNKELSPVDIVLLAVELMQYDEKVNKRQIIHFDKEEYDCFFIRRVRFAARMWVRSLEMRKANVQQVLPKTLPAFVYLVVRYYKSFLEDDPYFKLSEDLKTRFNGPTLMKLIAIALLNKDYYEKSNPEALQYMGTQIKEQQENALNYALGEVEKEIKRELDTDTATGENRALNLAIEFGLVNKFSKIRPKWGGTGAKLDTLEIDIDSLKPKGPQPIAEKFLIEGIGKEAAVKTFREWLTKNKLREGAATSVGNNCSLHVMHQFGQNDMTQEGEEPDDYNAIREKYKFKQGEMVELENFDEMVKDRNLYVQAFTLNNDGTIKQAGVFGQLNKESTNVRAVLHVGLHYEPLWPAK
ncbi:MAG: hypothetical protein JWQ98_2705 [Chlorobi bacterium]|nr:hypothetical protein [Chlorobiota bacterium]